MGIPTSAFRSGDLYIEYLFEAVLFRYEKETERFYRKFYKDSREHEIPHDSRLLCDAEMAGVLTTAERYAAGGAPDPLENSTAENFRRMAVRYQRARPYWISVMHRESYTRSGDIEVGMDGRLEIIKADDSIRPFLEKVVSAVNAQPNLEATCADGQTISIGKKSKDFDFGLRLALKNQELSVTTETSFYRGRSDP